MAVVALASARARARARRMAICALMPPADRFSVAHMEKVDFPAARISNSRRSSASVPRLILFCRHDQPAIPLQNWDLSDVANICSWCSLPRGFDGDRFIPRLGDEIADGVRSLAPAHYLTS